ncbi:MAG: DUF6088 family protein [Pseudomonadales bacterium]
MCLAFFFKEEGLQKLRNGLYYKPSVSKYFGLLPPKESAILKSIKKQYSATLLPSGSLAAYQLGFTPQAPEEKTYDTNKRIATIETGNSKINFRQVQGKKLFSANTDLVSLLLAIEFLFKEHAELNYLQQQSIKRQLNRYPYKNIEKAISHWSQWFRDKIMPFVKPEKAENYITGISAFNIPYRGQLADWHQAGMLSKNKFQIAGENYQSAPNLTSDELFDCSDFLNKHSVNLTTTMCAKPERAVKDILYSTIFIKNRPPSFFSVDQFILPLSNQELNTCIDQLRPLANKEQLKRLNQWLIDNGL